MGGLFCYHPQGTKYNSCILLQLGQKIIDQVKKYRVSGPTSLQTLSISLKTYWRGSSDEPACLFNRMGNFQYAPFPHSVFSLFLFLADYVLQQRYNFSENYFSPLLSDNSTISWKSFYEIRFGSVSRALGHGTCLHKFLFLFSFLILTYLCKLKQ